jgi:hypothetical protein
MIYFSCPPKKKEVRKRQWSFTDPVFVGLPDLIGDSVGL